VERQNPPSEDPLCPSAPPLVGESVAFGVVGGPARDPRVAYLRRALPVTQKLLDSTAPVDPAEVLRFASPCAAAACVHFDGANCQLAARIIQLLPLAVDGLPACAIRPRCRWWQQEGKAACMRCPLVITQRRSASDEYRVAATPVSERSSSRQEA